MTMMDITLYQTSRAIGKTALTAFSSNDTITSLSWFGKRLCPEKE
jgi:hypothetical protein